VPKAIGARAQAKKQWFNLPSSLSQQAAWWKRRKKGEIELAIKCSMFFLSFLELFLKH
jgi:hypothetical protein